MPTSLVRQPPFTNRVLGAFALLSVFGMIGLALTAMLGFEEPNRALFLLSSVLMVAAPVAMLVHLIVTRELTRREKRLWIRQLAGPHAARAFSAYLTSHDRSATADRFAAEALARSRDLSSWNDEP
jgi:hypothetical protein